MDYIQELTERYPRLEPAAPSIRAAYTALETAFARGGKLLVAGNGGSAADAGHIVGELMKAFVKKRRIPAPLAEKLRGLDSEAGGRLAEKLEQGLPAIALHAHTALGTATLNDSGGDFIYAQQVCGYGNAGDVFLGISTSGNARNVFYAALTAKAKGLAVIALTGGSGGKLACVADTAIVVGEKETYKIQELHLPVYHALCLALEERFFS